MPARSALRAGQLPWFEASIRAAPGHGRRNLRSLSSSRYGIYRRLLKTNGLVSSDIRATVSQTRLPVHRTILLESIPSVLTPPLVFVGLLVALWTYKCMMMVLFQDKIIYMPGIPPFARSEKIADYVAQCKPVEWEEKHIKSMDGINIALCVGRVQKENSKGEHIDAHQAKALKEVVICYFQGNGASLPHRLPILSSVLKSVSAQTAGANTSTRYTLVGLSYRGYWTSSGRARQSGIELDAQALLKYITTNFSSSIKDTVLILWGQSIGCGIATTAAASYLSQPASDKPRITGVVLETPFSSVKSMLIALYPQKWLPYRYLYPFLWNHWDSEAALRQIAGLDRKPKVLLLPASRDEVVPPEEIEKLEKICIDLKFDFERKDVLGALHNEATVRRDGQQAIAKFISGLASK